ncbi:MAG: hypothetical protein L0G31_07145 [Kocuria sp.]|nr:hypothetical protein [Kocuria sp.]
MVPLAPRVFTTAEPMVGPRVLLMVVPLVLRVFMMVVLMVGPRVLLMVVPLVLRVFTTAEPMEGPTALEPLRHHLPTPRIPNRDRGVGLSAHEL